MITANCRDRFTAEDFDFVIETLAKSEKESVSLVKLLTDNETQETLSSIIPACSRRCWRKEPR